MTNKHLLPVYDRPVLYYPLQTLVDAGIQDILIVTGRNNAGDFLRLLRNGKDFGFAYQEGERGIADALRLAEPFAAGERICVILGDNILENSIQKLRERFEQQKEGALILLKEVADPERFGEPIFEGSQIVRIEEKPKLPASPYAVIGVYFYDATVFDRGRGDRPGAESSRLLTSTIRICAMAISITTKVTARGRTRGRSNRSGGRPRWFGKRCCWPGNRRWQRGGCTRSGKMPRERREPQQTLRVKVIISRVVFFDSSWQNAQAAAQR